MSTSGLASLLRTTGQSMFNLLIKREASNIFTAFPQSSLRSRRQWQSSLTRLQVQCVRKVTQLGSDPEWFPDKSAQRLLQ